VLDAFSVEPRPDRETLERYLQAYPDYAEALVDLSRELSRVLREDETPLSAEERALIDAAWRRHAADHAANVVADPFAALSAGDLREVARRLDVPRQIVTAFREQRVILSSVPRRFLTRLADAVNSSVDSLEALWSDLIRTPAPARSYKADAKPTAVEPVSFERLLIDAGVTEKKRAELMADAD
jgi:hypothetical protein